jgi:hypothetical protein
MGRPHHLAEDRLFDCYEAERAGESLDPRSAEHLADCADCADRYAEFSRFMDGLRTDADAETDALFPADWQESQRQSILRRIDHLGHAARVITFPGRMVSQQMAKGVRLRVSPWAATAAAACLFVGVAVGMFYDARNHAPQSQSVVRAAPPAPAAQATAGSGPAPVAIDTDAFLSELERALGGPQTPELMSLDVLTPHVREIVFDAR